MSIRCASDLTVLELKEELRKLGLTDTGCKSKLIARLNRSIPSGTWSELQTEAQMSGIMVEVANEGSSHERPECGRERGTTETRSSPQLRDAPETEMEMMRRKLEQRNCFSCGLLNHVISDYPTKTKGPKCYKCGERGHIASKCVEQPKTVGAVDAQIARKKCVKEVSIGGRKMEALIDTGSDISLMRAELHPGRCPEAREKDGYIPRHRCRL
jgi:hypothetical protein